MKDFNRTLPADLDKLRKEIAKLFNSGWTINNIARLKKKDHATILYHLKKTGYVSKNFEWRKEIKVETYKPIQMVKGMETKLENVEMNFTKEKINEGKSYAEYTADKRYQQ